jgi:hypothetical protein
VPPSHVRGAATRGFPTPHQLTDQVRVVADLLCDPQVVVRTERSRHRLRETQVPCSQMGRGCSRWRVRAVSHLNGGSGRRMVSWVCSVSHR